MFDFDDLEEAEAGGRSNAMQASEVTLGLYWDNGKEHGNYYSIVWTIGNILGSYWANGKSNGNCYLGFRV